MRLVCVNAAGWWSLYEHQGRFFVDCCIEYFGTTKSRVIEIQYEDVIDPNKKAQLLGKPALLDDNLQVGLLETAEYTSRGQHPSPLPTDLSGDLLDQLNQVARTYNS